MSADMSPAADRAAPPTPARALLVVDVQNDFCEGGSLAVAGGSTVAAAITGYLRSPAARQYAWIVATRDHHVDPGSHFSDRPDYAGTWPPHCVAGTSGAAFHPDLDTSRFDEVFLKGEHAAAYSGFEGVSSGFKAAAGQRLDWIAGGPDRQPLANWLRERTVIAVDIAGIATDYCVRATAADAIRRGFAVRVLTASPRASEPIPPPMPCGRCGPAEPSWSGAAFGERGHNRYSRLG